MHKTGLIISLIVFAGAVVVFTLEAPASMARTAMILTAITAASTGLSFFLQLKQNRKSH